MRTLEKISTRLPLQSPRFLLGLLRLLLADGRSQCCSRACRFWRIKPLAMAAAMVAREWVWRRKGTDGRGAEGTREGRGGAHRGYPSGRLRGKPGGVGERSRGAQSRLGPIALLEERGARRAEAPRARRGELENSRPCPLPPGRVGARSGLGAAGAAGHHAPPELPWGPPPPLALSFIPARLPGRRQSWPPSSRALDGEPVFAGSPGICPSRARGAGLSTGLELPPGRCRCRCRRRSLLSASAGDCQVLWKSASGESNLLLGDL